MSTSNNRASILEPIAPAARKAPVEPAVPVKFEVGTIRQMYQRLHSEGIMISEYTIRLWVKGGLIPAIYVGSKALISYSNVLKVLNSSFDAVS